MDITQIQKNTKEVMRNQVFKIADRAKPIIEHINTSIEEASSQGESSTIFHVSKQLCQDVKLFKYIKKSYTEDGFKVQLSVVNANYNPKVEAIIISWADDEIRQLKEIVD